jgi:hypothetical protein
MGEIRIIRESQIMCMTTAYLGCETCPSRIDRIAGGLAGMATVAALHDIDPPFPYRVKENSCLIVNGELKPVNVNGIFTGPVSEQEACPGDVCAQESTVIREVTSKLEERLNDAGFGVVDPRTIG